MELLTTVLQKCKQSKPSPRRPFFHLNVSLAARKLTTKNILIITYLTSLATPINETNFILFSAITSCDYNIEMSQINNNQLNPIKLISNTSA